MEKSSAETSSLQKLQEEKTKEGDTMNNDGKRLDHRNYIIHSRTGPIGARLAF